MGQPAARVTDMQTCPMVTAIVPHVGGPITLGCFTVLVGEMPQARITDMHTCVGPRGSWRWVPSQSWSGVCRPPALAIQQPTVVSLLGRARPPF